MIEVFVIRNQHGHYWGKSKRWVDGSQPRHVLRAKHHDEAVNTLVELGSKDFELRGDVLATQLSERGEPIIEPSQIPLPIDPADELSEDSSDTESGAASDAPGEESAEPSA